ncbi:MAG: 16S rRNA (cytosine(1402)-N(4))-methyltransferase RsmH [Sandaracinaceae bacterium]
MSAARDIGPEAAHSPVMRDEVLRLLAPRDGGVYADVTLGRGGHAEAILEASAPSGRLVAVDRDLDALEGTRPRLARFGERVTYVHGVFSGLRDHLAQLGISQLDGLVADLGVSSPQLDTPERGFSFRAEGPLDMRMDATRGRTARELIADLDERELADLLYRYGEERKSRPIARSIKRAEAGGALETTLDLARAIWRVTGPRRVGIDPATRSFQALRIAVNAELEELESLLTTLPDVLADGGVAAIIAFHSLEDRAVKHSLREEPRLDVLTKRPLEATEAEASANPRARSAKLRCARRRPRALDGAPRGGEAWS